MDSGGHLRLRVVAACAAALLLLLCAAPALAVAAAATTTKDTRSASERRADGSKFEQQKLDQSAFQNSNTTTPTKKSSSGGSFLRAMFGLAVVVALIYGVYWLLKKWSESRMQGMAGMRGVIDVVATTPLAQNRALHLVRVGPELVLVGATDQSITRIGDIDTDALSAHMGEGTRSQFDAILSGAMHAAAPGTPATDGRDSFLKRFIDNLRITTAR